MSRRAWFPAFLDLEGRRCLVVGSGGTARPRVDDFLEAGADLTVVAPDARERLGELAAAERLVVKARPFEPADVDGAFLVVAATDDAALNRRVHRAARAAGALVNVVDTLPRCDWIAASRVRRGDLQVAFSTSGRAPALAARLRRSFEDRLDELAPESFLERARLWRRRVLRSPAAPSRRRAAWAELAERWADATGPSSAVALPPDLEHPLRIPDSDGRLAALGVLGADLLHALVPALESWADALVPAGEVRRRLLALRADDGSPLLDDLAVRVGRERAELAFTARGGRRDDAVRAAERLLAELGRAGGARVDADGLACFGAEAGAHLLAAEAGLRSLVPFSEPEIVERAGPVAGGLLGELDAAARAAGTEARRLAAADPARDSLARLAAGTLSARLPEGAPVALVGAPLAGLSEALRAEGLAPVEWLAWPEAAPELGVVLTERPSDLHHARREGRHAWVLDVAVPRVAPAELAPLHDVTSWDLDALADATVVSGVEPARAAQARARLEETLEDLVSGRVSLRASPDGA